MNLAGEGFVNIYDSLEVMHGGQFQFQFSDF